MDAMIEELKRLHEVIGQKKWAAFCDGNTIDVHEDTAKSSPVIHWMGFDGANHCQTTKHATAEWIATIHNAFPAILRKLEAAERLRDDLMQIMAPTVNNMGEAANQAHRVAMAIVAYDKETA